MSFFTAKPGLTVEFRGKYGDFEHKTLQSIGADICCQGGEDGDKGWSGHDWVILPSSTVMLPTGLFITDASILTVPVSSISITPLTMNLIPYADVRPRSSLNKKGIIGAFGTIDADYRDEIRVILTNQTKENYRIKPGDRIAQLVCHYGFQVASVCQQERQGGFGSTGK